MVYLTNRTRRWALIPTAILALIGIIPLLSAFVGGDWMGAAVMFLFAVPFFIVYFRWKENWWALIPAGVFASIGLVVILGMLVPKNQPVFESVLNGLLLLGFGLTFGALWLLRATRPTAWAIYPAIGLLVAAVPAFFFGGNDTLFWPIAVLAVGIVLVVYSFLRKKPESQP